LGNRASSDMLFGHCGDPLRFCDTADRFSVGEDFVVADIVVSQKAGDGQKTEQNGEDDPDIDEVHFSLTPCRENLAPITGVWNRGESLGLSTYEQRPCSQGGNARPAALFPNSRWGLRFSSRAFTEVPGALRNLQNPQPWQRSRQRIRDQAPMPRHRKNLPTRKFRLAPAVVGPSCLSSPILFGLSRHRRSIWVFELEPVRRPAGPIART
jgi:hypothetical protein